VDVSPSIKSSECGSLEDLNNAIQEFLAAVVLAYGGCVWLFAILGQHQTWPNLINIARASYIPYWH
jgi:nitrate reductase NapE component